jgi:C-terminal peptidase prc
MNKGGRGLWLVGAMLLLNAALAAPPPHAGGPAQSPDPQLDAVSRDYAAAIFNVIANVEQKYVRPVRTADLVEAALAGLYEAVRQPIPPTLHADLQRMDDIERMICIRRVREELGDHDALRGSRALIASLRALPRALDPYCGVLGPKEFSTFEDGERAPFAGLEFPLSESPQSAVNVFPGGNRLGDPSRPLRDGLPAGPIRIAAVQPGSPAQKADVRPGDLIIAIDGRPPEDPGFSAAFQRMQPIRSGVAFDPRVAAAPIKLRLLRPSGTEPIDVTITPALFRIESVFGVQRRPDGAWDYSLHPGDRIGYIRIGRIQSHTHREFVEALRSLRSPSVGGLILDLRWCPGGYLGESTAIARSLLAPNQTPIALQRERSGQLLPVPVDADQSESESADFPLIVLVNGETSGGGELIAAALQDHGRAVVAGQKTVGKSSVQRSLSDLGIPFKYTTNILIRPRSRNAPPAEGSAAEDWIVRPNPGKEIPATTELSRQLKQAWLLHTLRPVGSSESLPIDDPEYDPQRQAALQMLREMMGRSGS